MMMRYLSELVHAQMEHRRPDPIPEGISVDELLTIARRHHMQYMIMGALMKTDLEEERKVGLKQYLMSGVMMSLAQICCLKDLEEKLEREGIYHMFLKGAVLKDLYPAPELREMSDIDVMIYDHNLDRARKVLEGMGFHLLESVKHHDIYRKEPWLVLELHNALYDKDVDRIQYEHFQNKSNLKPKEGRKYALQFTPEDFYVYLISHMAKHFYETGCGIRNLVDVYIYRKHYENSWDETVIADELKKCGLTAFEARIHTLARVWLGGEEADSYSRMLFSYMVDCGIYGKGEYGMWGQFALLNKDKSIKHQSYAKWWYYFPPRGYMQRDYPWLKKYPALLSVAWIIRAIHGLFSKEGREKRRMLLNLKNEEVFTINEIYKGMQLNFNKD